MSKNREVEKKKEEQRLWLLEHLNGLLTSADKRDWFGKISIDIKRGMIDMVRVEKTVKPPE